jgi:hypothetical protein
MELIKLSINLYVPYIELINIYKLKTTKPFCVLDNPFLHVLHPVTFVAFFSFMIIF